MTLPASPPPKAPPVSAPAVRVIGAPPTPLRDIYHAFLRARWWQAIGGIVVFYLLLNAVFALAYVLVGGVANARPGSYVDAFHFSIQTMGTIGYGAMYPTTPISHALVTMESVTGLLVLALVTGLVFAKFSRSTARIAFSRHVVIAPMDGVPTLMVRIGNERNSQIMDAHVHVAMIRTERTREGMTFYRMIDLTLSRDRSPALSRSWTAMHPITADSPLSGQTPASLAAAEVELLVSVAGVDDTTVQPVHAQYTYPNEAIVWGKRHTDVLSELPDGTLALDVRKFHETVDCEATDAFPYGRPTTSGGKRDGLP